jgi:hypothetical protein
MTNDPLTTGFNTRDALRIPEITVLWMTAGLGCDGDTIAVTAATQPEESNFWSGRWESNKSE